MSDSLRSQSPASASPKPLFPNVLQNIYQNLGPAFSTKAAPLTFPNPSLIAFNAELATELGLPHAAQSNAAQLFSGQQLLPGSSPVAQAYAGHQFGNFVPQLGDGRALLLGECVLPDGSLRDIQLKGAGPTPFSRRGDGRAALGPVIREYLVSEALHALGIPTTRALAIVSTGDRIQRETQQPGAILTRIAKSHIRIGTFEYFAARGDTDSLKILAEHVIARHHPACNSFQSADRYLTLLAQICAVQARLIAQWMRVGFIHGVMNTDNTTVSGETLDFGPCAFLDEYDPMKKFSYIDTRGRYAFANQPSIAFWNLTRLAECLLPLCAKDPADAIPEATAALQTFQITYRQSYQQVQRSKLGLTSEHPDDENLFNRLLGLMKDQRADFTRTFHSLIHAASPSGNPATPRLFVEIGNSPSSRQWLSDWLARLRHESLSTQAREQLMRDANPFIIPRNHRIEESIRAAEDHGDLSVFIELHAALQKPQTEDPQTMPFAAPPTEEQKIQNTFCGT